MTHRLYAIAIGCAFALSCTAVNKAVVPSTRVEPGKMFVTTGDIKVPYRSLGPVQATRRGALVFGFLDPAGLSIQECINRDLVPELHRMGADGIINVQFEQTQYLLPARIAGAVLFFAPLPAEVTVRGEAVKLE